VSPAAGGHWFHALVVPQPAHKGGYRSAARERTCVNCSTHSFQDSHACCLSYWTCLQSHVQLLVQNRHVHMCLQRVGQDSESALRGAVEVLITEVFGDTERNLAKVRSQRSPCTRAGTLLVWSACLVCHSICSCMLTGSSSWCSGRLLSTICRVNRTAALHSMQQHVWACSPLWPRREWSPPRSGSLLILYLLFCVQSGVNLASSGTTASVAFQRGNRLWVASAGDSRAILCTRNSRDQWRALPLTIDHRPRRTSERER
jgi:hypothetical protein